MSAGNTRPAGRRAGPTALAVGLASLVGAAAPAHGYEFAARARILTQAYQLRAFRLGAADAALDRHRFSQALWLTLWDVGDLAKQRARARLARSGPTVSWHSHLRLDHDFGAFAAGRIADPAGADGTADALDAIPELADDTLALTLSYGYLQIDGLLRDRLALRIGRMVSIDADDLRVTDGMEAAIRIARPLELVASGGLAARDASPLAASGVELDGTSGADCQEYVEAVSPGAGEWRLIDRSLLVERRPLASDLYVCPQRAAWTPTAGLALASVGLEPVELRVSYRRTSSRSAGLLGAADRLDYPDLGLYPNEVGQTPRWGVNEERLGAEARVAVRAGPARVTPWAQARASVAERVLDRAAAGVAIAVGAHRLEPEVRYRRPSFDLDSVFVVFAPEPTTDLRLTWGWRGLDATGWVRWYHGAADEAVAYGADVVAARAITRRWRGRAGLVADAGYGGTRLGTDAAGEFLASRTTRVTAGLSAWRLGAVDPARTWLEGIATARVSWRPDPEQFALHGVVEASASRYSPGAARVLLVLDLGFAPEM
jgi:hypothetical protein